MRRRNASGSRTSPRSAFIQRMKASCTNVLGVRHGAEHAVGDAHELWTQRVETARCVLVPGVRHQAAAALAVALMAAGSANTPKPTAMRFHPLMILIIKVSLTCSSSVNCAFRAS